MCLFSVQIQMNPEDDVIYSYTFTPNYTDQQTVRKDNSSLKLQLCTPP